MALSANFDIMDAINRIREIRSRFLVDNPAEAYESSAAMVDRLWPLQSGQMNRNNLHLKLYQPNPKAKDQEAEKRNRLYSALLAKLALPDWGYADNEGKDQDTLINELERDLQLMAKDGISPYERYVKGDTMPKFSDETRRYNESMHPKQREQMFSYGLDIPKDRKRGGGRKRTRAEAPNEVVRKALFVRSRENWRPDTIAAVCERIRILAQWIEEQDEGDKLVATFVERYRFDDLVVSQSKYAPTEFAHRLACAIVSAEHLKSGTDDYAASSALSIPVTFYYGLYLLALKQSKRSKKAPTSFLNKALISNAFQGV